jgi:hypothetical protein
MINQGNVEMVAWLADHAPEALAQIDPRRGTFAHFAASKKRWEVLKWLLHRYPAWIKYPDQFKNTPFSFAEKEGQTDLVAELLSLVGGL